MKRVASREDILTNNMKKMGSRADLRLAKYICMSVPKQVPPTPPPKKIHNLKLINSQFE
jgi:hypothetical protein